MLFISLLCALAQENKNHSAIKMFLVMSLELYTSEAMYKESTCIKKYKYKININ